MKKVACCCWSLFVIFSVSAESTGWRGDGSGRYPDAQPPLQWSRDIQSDHDRWLSRTRAPNDQPEGDRLIQTYQGRGAGHFSPAQWMMHGPFAVPKGQQSPLDHPLVANEAELNPNQGSWREIAGGDMKLSEILGDYEGRQGVYLHTWLYLPQDGITGVRSEGPEWGHYFHFWIDGKVASGWEGHRHQLSKGWHRILIKITSPAPPTKWQCRISFFPFHETLTYKEQGFAWITPMPDACYGMPIIVGENLYTLSEPNDLLCLNKQDGRVKWMHANPLWDVLSENERDQVPEGPALIEKLKGQTAKNALSPSERLERLKTAETLLKNMHKALPKYKIPFGWGGGNCAPTPVTDGTHLFCWLGETGILSKYTLEGKREWIRFHHSGNGGEHGVNASPILIGDRLVVIGGKCVIAFDKKSGDELWRSPYRGPCYSSLGHCRVGEVDFVICGTGEVLRVDTGGLTSKPIGRHDGECASPIVVGKRFYLVSRGGFACAEIKPDFTVETVYNILPKTLDPDCEIYCVGSPVFHEGIVYFVRSGWGFGPNVPKLYALNADTGAVLYRQSLDFDSGIFYHPKGAGVSGSLCLAGNAIYVNDNRGTTIVFEPGPTYRQLALNPIEHLFELDNRQEVTNSTLVFEGSRIYFRGQENMYCMERE
jgi:outer membrane protein assembly factor BamB